MAGRYGLDCTPRSSSARMVVSRSSPRGSWTTKTNQPRTSPPWSSHGSSTALLRQRRPVPAGHPRPRGEHLVEALELGEPDRGRHVREPVVEAEAIVVEPAHVRRAALVALGVDPLLVLGRAHGEHPALAGRELLVGVEAERRRVTRARRPACRPRAARRAPRRRPRRSAGRGPRAPARRPGSRRCAPGAAPSCGPVMAAAAASGSRFKVTGSMSANTGLARS